MYTGTFGPISNRADWSETISLRENDDDEPVSLVEIAVRIGGCANIEKTMTGGGVTYDEAEGEFTFTFSEGELDALKAGNYPFGIVIETDAAKEQLFAGEVAVIDGVVS
jgi:hypothetical protein